MIVLIICKTVIISQSIKIYTFMNWGSIWPLLHTSSATAQVDWYSKLIKYLRRFIYTTKQFHCCVTTLLFWATREVEAKLRVTLDDQQNKCQYQCQCKTKATQISLNSNYKISADVNIKKVISVKEWWDWMRMMLVAENEALQTQEPDTGESQTQETVVKPANFVFN